METARAWPGGIRLAQLLAAFVVPASLLLGCSPKDTIPEPTHPLLAGLWQSKVATETCELENIRFENSRIVLRHMRQDAIMFEIKKIEAHDSSIDLELEFAKFTLHAVRDTMANASAMAKRQMYVSLSVTADSISLQDVQIADPDRGRYAPSRIDRDRFAEVFSFKKCAQAKS